MAKRTRYVWLLLIGLMVPFPAFSSDQTLEDGKKLHDMRDYDGAIRIYEAILKDDPNNVLARYELGFSLYYNGEYKKTSTILKKLLKDEPDYNPLFYVTLGSALDELREFKNAETVLREGLEHFPDSSFLHFNLGVNLGMQGRQDEAIREFIEDVRLKPDHLSGWYYLAGFHFDKRERHRAFLLYARFLSLESGTERAKVAADRLWKLIFVGVSQRKELNSEGKKQIDVQIQTADPNGTDPKGARTMGMSLVAAARFTEKEEDLNDAQFFIGNVGSILDILSEMGEDKDPDGFWKNHVLNFFSEAKRAGVMDTLAHLMRKPIGEADVTSWIETHPAEVEKYRQFLTNWKPPTN